MAAVLVVVVLAAVIGSSGDDSEESTGNSGSSEYSEVITQPPTEASKYQKTNSYNIPCNGNSELAIEAANVFADKYGGSRMEGTYRYTYSWAGTTYTATRKFEITDYGTYRNYSWEGDIANLFYGS